VFSATTTEAIRRAIQHSQESLRALARRHGVNSKTVAKWKKRESTADRRTGPTVPRSTVLSVEPEATVIAFRKHTRLPLDDCLYALQAPLPQLIHSSLHRCRERHGIRRLPEVEGDRPRWKKFESYPIGFFPIDLAEARTAEDKLYGFAAIDRTSKFVVVKLVERADRQAAAAFLEALVEAVPYRIPTVLTDNGIQFAELPKKRQGQPPAGVAIPSTGSVSFMESNPDSPSSCFEWASQTAILSIPARSPPDSVNSFRAAVPKMA
jgi:transposase-like protein